MALKLVPTYSDGTNTVTFVDLDPKRGARPGFSHRVIVNKKSVGFLQQGHRPNRKSAEYFLKSYFELYG